MKPLTVRNTSFMANLDQKAEDQPEKYESLKAKADQIDALAANFDNYLDDLKRNMIAKIDDPTDYEIMDKGDYLDENFFKGDKFKPEGRRIFSSNGSVSEMVWLKF